MLGGLLCATTLMMNPTSVAAVGAPYGKSNYGQCTYGPCKTEQHTTVTTPDELKVAINLTDGQTIPASGYEIIVTPLNGAGTSFQKVEVYVDGQLVGTAEPGADGSASVWWDPVRFPGSEVTIKVTDSSGQTVSHVFTVTVPNEVASPAQPSGEQPTSAIPEKTIGLTKLVEGAKNLIRRLPTQVVYSFPYALFMLLFAELIMLLMHARRELRELRTLRWLSGRAERLTTMKSTFLELVSHYLRTPLTIMQAGAEGLEQEAGVPSEAVKELQTVLGNIHATIESTISQTASVVGASSDSEARLAVPRLKAGGYVAVWLPVVGIGAVAFAFIFLANEVTDIKVTAVSLITQILIYLILIAAIFQLIRRRQLSRRDAKIQKQLLEQETALQTARDQIIDQTSIALQAYVSRTKQLTAQLPAGSKNTTFITRGLSQLSNVESKFIIASRLKGTQSNRPFVLASAANLRAHILPEISERAKAKNIQLAGPLDMQLAMQEPELLTVVLQSLIDNAVASSAEGSQVTIEAKLKNNMAAISVTDHGAGLSEQQISSLFQPFVKIEGAETFNREGMGFSLYLDSLIMTYLGGSIDLESKPGSGAVAKFSWPQGVVNNASQI
jgi:signal transduction histidine kinase